MLPPRFRPLIWEEILIQNLLCQKKMANDEISFSRRRCVCSSLCIAVPLLSLRNFFTIVQWNGDGVELLLLQYGSRIVEWSFNKCFDNEKNIKKAAIKTRSFELFICDKITAPSSSLFFRQGRYCVVNNLLFIEKHPITYFHVAYILIESGSEAEVDTAFKVWASARGEHSLSSFLYQAWAWYKSWSSPYQARSLSNPPTIKLSQDTISLPI